MSTFKNIQDKLEQFIKKYYTNELIRGIILFFSIGLLYFLITLLVEYYLWLSTAGRALLFWTFVVVEVFLFARFIVFPLAKLFRLQKGLDYFQASKIIGNHFPEVSDKLLNVLQLKQNSEQSELLLASIEQKSNELQPVPFVNAVNFKKNTKYLKYAAIPVALYLLFTIAGGSDIFSSSYKRMVNYSTAYEPPAPFAFYVLNEDLNAIEDKPFTLQIKVAGDVLPDNASINYNGQSYYLQKNSLGSFQYTFQQPIDAIEFELYANAVKSKPYTLDVVKVPSLLSFEMALDYPSYTQKSDETVKGTGNATIPEGTKIVWKMNTKQTDNVNFHTADTVFTFQKNKPQFQFSKTVYNKLDYAVSTSNEFLKEYENLAFSINVIKDQYPEITIEAKQDTVNSRLTYFFGRVSDDYGLSKLQLVYHPENEENNKQFEQLSLNKSNFDQFLFAFPGALNLEEGKTYTYYFEVFDNDGVNGAKSTKSSSFSYRKLTIEELETEQLKEQKEAFQGLDSSLQKMQEQKEQLDELSRLQKEKKELSWNDQKKIEEFLKRQQQQEELMKKFSEQMKENLENFEKDKEQQDPKKEELQQRLEENEKKLNENEKLLEELQKLQEKIANEELFEKLEKLGKENKKQQRNLEQLLELTKRYYVEKKAEKLAEELEKLAERQEALSEKSEEENTQEKQDELNEKFEEYMEEMEELQKENEALKSPMNIPDQNAQEQEVQQEQQNASENLQKQQQGEAQQNQKNAAKKMKEMSQAIQVEMQSGSSEQSGEDAAMLRQIVDNLVTYSISQEDLMLDFNTMRPGNPSYGSKLVRQQELKQNFQHVDDSLFALAMRNAMVGTVINDLIEEVHYNTDKSLEFLADSNTRMGVSSQQYSLTGANELAVLLESALDNMMMQMQGEGQGQGKGQGKGQGQGEGFQLPDIIKQQESLNGKMEEGMKGEKGEGEEGEEGEGKGGEGEGEGEDGQGKGSEGQGDDGEGEGEGSGNGNRNNGKGENDREGKPENEFLHGQLYEIFQQQQMLRFQLEDRIRQEGLPADARELTRKMEEVEQELLERGFNQETLKKMNEIKHQLLKLEKAAFQQGEEEKRQGITNKQEFQNTLNKQLENAKNYFNNVEILNRQQLPLRQVYKQKVQEYFNTNND